MAGVIEIQFYLEKEPLKFSGNTYVAEDLIVESCKHLKIGPVGRHLFGLWSPSDSLWFPPNKVLKTVNGCVLNLYLRVRFLTPVVSCLRDKTDDHTFNYYFHQVRNDFVEGRIPELCQTEKRENALGLVATDIIRLMLESNTTPETMKFNSKNFIPHVLRKSSFWDNFLRSPLDRAISRGWKYTKQNPGFVKGSYIQQLIELVPDYGAEIYSVLIDEGGKVYEVELAVNPFHPHYPGLRIRIKKSKDDWTRICGIEDLCYISMRSDETVEISRQNGVPQYIQFSSKAQRYSFVSLLDGYYR